MVITGFQATVLGPALFRHIHAPQNLQPADHRRCHSRRHLVNRVQHPVDAKTQVALFPPGFDMNIAGALGKGVLHQPVHNIDDVLIVGIGRCGTAKLHHLFKIIQRY